MKFFYRLICLIYAHFFTFCEYIFLKNKKIQNNMLKYTFKNVNFASRNIESFETEIKNKYFHRVIFPENEIYSLIHDIFVKNNLSNKISNLTGYKYSISFFTAYKTFKLSKEDATKNIYANHFHQDKPYSNNMIKIIFSFNQITEKDGPMEININKIEKICLDKKEIFLFYPRNVFHRATSPENGERFQMMFQLNPAINWKINKKIFIKQKNLEPKFPFFTYFFDQKKNIF